MGVLHSGIFLPHWEYYTRMKILFKANALAYFAGVTSTKKFRFNNFKLKLKLASNCCIVGRALHYQLLRSRVRTLPMGPEVILYSNKLEYFHCQLLPSQSSICEQGKSVRGSTRVGFSLARKYQTRIDVAVVSHFGKGFIATVKSFIVQAPGK